MKRYSKDDLMVFVIDYMKKLNVSEEHARIIGDVLISADNRGVASHGLHRLGSYYGTRLKKGFINPNSDFKIISETSTTALIDGNNGCGQVVADTAMEMAINKAKDHSIGLVTVRNSNHYGIAAYYSMKALKHGMIGISLTNSQPLVSPTYGKKQVLGTNPISVSVPSKEKYPYVLDMATSAVAYGKVQIYEKENKTMPVGWAINSEGQVTTNPSDIKPGVLGALLPLGGMDETAGYKGYGLSLLVEILCSVLSGGNILSTVGPVSKPDPTGVSHFFMAINIESFRPLLDFTLQMDKTIEILKNTPLAKGYDEIKVAGEKEFVEEEFNRINGVPLYEKVVEDLIKEGLDIGVPFNCKPLD